MRHLLLLFLVLYTISTSAQSKRERGITAPYQPTFISDNLDHKPNTKHVKFLGSGKYVTTDQVINAVNKEHYRMRKQYSAYAKAVINVYGALTERNITVIDPADFVDGKIVVAQNETN